MTPQGQLSRRRFLESAASLTAVLGHARAVLAQPSRSRLILLGTGGGPRPRTASAAAAQVIVSQGVAYVVDCGDGVARQLAFAGVPLASVRHVFVTHQHSDHNADYGNLLLLAWTAGLRTRVDTWGPPPIERMTALFFEMNKYDIDVRIENEGRPPLVPLIHAHAISAGGEVMRDERMKVRGTVTIQINPGEPNAPPPSTGDMTWTFEVVPQTNMQSLRATIRSSHPWLTMDATGATALSPGNSPPTAISTHGEFNSPRGCRGTFGSVGNAEATRIEADFTGTDCPAVFSGRVILTKG